MKNVAVPFSENLVRDKSVARRKNSPLVSFFRCLACSPVPNRVTVGDRRSRGSAYPAAVPRDLLRNECKQPNPKCSVGRSRESRLDGRAVSLTVTGGATWSGATRSEWGGEKGTAGAARPPPPSAPTGGAAAGHPFKAGLRLRGIPSDLFPN